MISSLIAELQSELNGQVAQEHVRRLGQFFRAPGSSGFHAAIEYVASKLREAQIDHSVESFPLDGRTNPAGITVPLAWEPRGATLELVKPFEEVLLSWETCPSCVPWWCPPTPPEGIPLQLVDVGKGQDDADFEHTAVHGKAVLVEDGGENFAWPDIVSRAERYGAAAVISNYLLYQFEPWRTRESLPEAVQQLRLRPRPENPWALTIGQQTFERLRSLLRTDPSGVTVRVSIDAESFAGTSQSVFATLTGSLYPEESVILVAHVTAATKPGANCASGVALLLELAKAIRTLSSEGRIPPLRRSIHFLFANEDLGSLNLVAARPALRDRVIAAIAVCSVGHDQSQTKSSLIIGRSPDSLPTFLNDLIEGLIELVPRELGWAYRTQRKEIPRVAWKVLPYTPWSDNVTWAKMGVPALLCMSLPDRYFHTQLLTAAETDPEVFTRSGLVLGAAAVLTAVAEWPETNQILNIAAARSEAHLNEVGLRAMAARPPGPSSADRRRSLNERASAFLSYTNERDIDNMRTALSLVRHAPERDQRAASGLMDGLEEELRRKTRRLQSEIEHVDASVDHDPAPSAAISPVSKLVFKKAPQTVPHGVPGLSYGELVELVTAMRRRDPTLVIESTQLFVDELWNLSDGTATIEAITRTLSFEFDFDLDPEHIAKLAEALESAGYLELCPSSAALLQPGRILRGH